MSLDSGTLLSDTGDERPEEDFPRLTAVISHINQLIRIEQLANCLNQTLGDPLFSQPSAMHQRCRDWLVEALMERSATKLSAL